LLEKVNQRQIEKDQRENKLSESILFAGKTLMANNESSIKIVGKRVNKLTVDWEQVNGFLKLVVELNQKNKFIPKGVYRFKSHQENDEWIMKVLTDR